VASTNCRSERDTVPRASLVEVGEVDADSPLTIFLLHEDRIGDPVRIECLSDESGLEQAVDFFATPFFVHYPKLLLYWFSVGLDGEFVTDDPRVNSRHIDGRPLKHV